MPQNTPRRRQILTAAERLLNHYGAHKTTVADIARAAKIGVGTVYLEFSSKDAIIGELSHARHRAVLERMEEAAQGAFDNVEQGLRAMLDARLDALLLSIEGGPHAVDLVHSLTCAPVHEAWREFQRNELDLFTALLERGEAEGSFALDDAQATARVLVCAYASFASPSVFAYPGEHLKGDLERLHHVVLQGLIARQ